MRRYLPNTADALGAAEAKRVHQVDQTGLKSRNGPGSCALCVLSLGGSTGGGRQRPTAIQNNSGLPQGPSLHSGAG